MGLPTKRKAREMQSISCEFHKLQAARGLPNKGHSDDIVTVYSGHAVPHELCGFHATYYLPDFYDFLRTA